MLLRKYIDSNPIALKFAFIGSVEFSLRIRLISGFVSIISKEAISFIWLKKNYAFAGIWTQKQGINTISYYVFIILQSKFNEADIQIFKMKFPIAKLLVD
jgi:hypothetical protein